MSPEERLAEHGVVVPEAPAPAAAYAPVARTGSLIHVSGQLPTEEGRLLATGKLGAGVDTPTGVRCARQCLLNVLAQLATSLDGLARVRRVAKLTVYVASAPSFTEHHLVANGASELVMQAFGDEGDHARAAVGAPSLPMDTPVEVDAVAEVS